MRRRIDTTMVLIIVGAVFLICFAAFGSYLGVGILLKADLPIVRKFIEPQIIPEVSYDAYTVAGTWSPLKVYEPVAYKPCFTSDETEDEFFIRMIDIDRKSLYQLTREFPELLDEGWSYIKFDATESEWFGNLTELDVAIKAREGELLSSTVVEADTADAVIDTVPVKEASETTPDTVQYPSTDPTLREMQLVQKVLSGAVTTKQGNAIYAIDGLHSIMLVYTEVNATPGYMAISYDKSKLALSITYRAHEGLWSPVGEHIKYSDNAFAAVPANDYTYNARMGYGVVAGGLYDNNVPRYKMSQSTSLYMGFSRDGTFAVGEGARYGMANFSEGQGTLLIHGAAPERVVVPDSEQKQVLDHLALYIEASGKDVEAEGFDSVPLIKGFLESYDDFQLQARYSWVIKENALASATEAELTKVKDYMQGNKAINTELVRLVAMCDGLGAGTYAAEIVPVRCAFSAIGQRKSDGATILFGIGGAKRYDVKDVPGNGATFDELQGLFLKYGATNAAVTTSGNRVGFAWKDRNMLHVQDTNSEGGHTYSAFTLN